MYRRTISALAIAALAAICHTAAPSAPLSNGLALIPPMGWNSWNFFGEVINETLVKETMDAMRPGYL
jgi:alpha-galactosidase